jgi:hypothetical protein
MGRNVKKPDLCIRRQLWKIYKDLRRAGLSISVALSLLYFEGYPRWHGRLGNKIYMKKKGGHKSYFTRGEYGMFVFEWLRQEGVPVRKAFEFIDLALNIVESSIKAARKNARNLGALPLVYDEDSRDSLELNALGILRKNKTGIRMRLGTDNPNWRGLLRDTLTDEVLRKLSDSIG